MDNIGTYNNILLRAREQRILHSVALELTYRCNLDCFFCYNDRAKQGTPLSLGHYQQLLQDLSRMQTLHLMLSGGEPMIHPHFFAIGTIARDLGFLIRIRTNGHSLSNHMAKRLRDEVDPYVVEVSLHGATAESHDRQTRVKGSFDRLIKNIIVSKNVGLKMSIVTTPTSWNEHEIEDMFTLCDSIDVPLRFQGPVAPRDNGDTNPLVIQPAESTWDYVSKRVRERRTAKNAEISVNIPHAIAPGSYDNEKSSPREKKINATCGVGVAGVDIDPYGNVQACLHLQESAGNIQEQSIEEIWNHSPLFQRARSRAVSAAQQFQGIPIKQFGAPLYCLAVEENCNKGGCGQHN